MGWKSVSRSYKAEVRRIEREQRRRQRELQRQQKQLAKMEEQARAILEVEMYENQVELLQSVCRECGPVWDWEAMCEAQPLRELASRTPAGNQTLSTLIYHDAVRGTGVAHERDCRIPDR